MSVHEKIRLVREAKGLTQEQVAEKLDMSPNGYGDIERGDSDIKLSKLEKIAELFEIKLSELFELNEKEVFNIDYKKNKSCNWYLNSSSIELEKQLLINELKDKEIAYLKVQILQLQEINALLKSEPPQPKPI
jgi:transcriptional regulator with XRE-family HTH domain